MEDVTRNPIVDPMTKTDEKLMKCGRESVGTERDGRDNFRRDEEETRAKSDFRSFGTVSSAYGPTRTKTSESSRRKSIALESVYSLFLVFLRSKRSGDNNN